MMVSHVAILLFALEWFFLVVLLAFRDRGLLVLLVLGDKVVHVRFSLGEFHLVHTFARIPMKESLASEHGAELVANACLCQD